MHASSAGSRVDFIHPLQVVALIPARFASTRFPGKPLADIDGRPMIEHVYRRAESASYVTEVIVATDDLRIATRVSDFGGRVRLTKATHQSGTDRLAEVVAKIDCDIAVNVQGDEPLIDPRAIDQSIAPLLADPTVQMTTLYKRITQASELMDPNIVKVVVDRGGYALYFSRAPIPYIRDPRGGKLEQISAEPRRCRGPQMIVETSDFGVERGSARIDGRRHERLDRSDVAHA